MTYAETIEYLYARLPMFTRIGAAAYKEDLHNTIALLDALGNPHHSFKTIHVAGTNGKGSTSHMLAAIMQSHGYKTGLYTSPHLIDFRERIKVNGQWIAEKFIIDFTEKIKPVIEAIEPSFFEVTVAMAFEWFKQQKVDIAIIEAGLGGRLDSTNIITPELSVITNIGWDHMNLLGDTLQQIAGEKAGIIKPGIPVVIGETVEETRPVFEAKARLENSQITFAEDALAIEKISFEGLHLNVDFKQKENHKCWHITCDLPGIYQQYNLRTTLTATAILQKAGWLLQNEKIESALRQIVSLTGLHGRWEIIHAKPTVVLDVAHNVNGIAHVLMQVATIKQQAPDTTIHWIMGMVKDKDITKVLAMLPPNFQFYFTQAQLPRALPAIELQEMAASFNLKGKSFVHVDQALQEAMHHAAANDIIIVCGSVFVVGEVTKPISR